MGRLYMHINLKNIGILFKVTLAEWYRKDPFRQSAIIAYYAIFSIPGLLVMIVTIAGYFFEKEVVSRNIIHQIASTMGSGTAAQIEDMLSHAGQSQSTILGSIIGIAILLIGATGVFVELQKTLNTIWHVEAVPQKEILLYLKSRLFSFGLILAIAFLLLISLVVSTALATIDHWVNADTSKFMIGIFNIINFIFSLVIISTLFALMFKILPDAKIEWKHVWLGSLVTGLLFTIGKTGLAFYFAKAEPGSVFGAAGSVILILLWVSYSSMIMFLGAEFTATYAKMYSGKVAPSTIAKVEPPSKH